MKDLHCLILQKFDNEVCESKNIEAERTKGDVTNCSVVKGKKSPIRGRQLQEQNKITKEVTYIKSDVSFESMVENCKTESDRWY